MYQSFLVLFNLTRIIYLAPNILSGIVVHNTLRENFLFSYNRTEFREIRNISPYSEQMQENMDQRNSEYGHFSRNNTFICYLLLTLTENRGVLQQPQVSHKITCF